MTAQVCCVDHERPGVRSIAGRWFCDEHYAKATHRRSGALRSELVTVFGVLVFVAVVYVLDLALRPDLTGVLLVLVGVLLAIVPAALWLTFFYRQDRLEPEPVKNVARMFIIGLALAAAFGIPLTDQLFRVQDWLYRDRLTTVLGSIFVIGSVEAFMVYAAVRYFIYDSPEFDERADGVIYGTAAAVGYATALNLQFILSNRGAALGTGEIFVAEVALAHAAFGGLLGYFLSKARLEQEPSWWLPLGLGLTALLNGSFNILRGQLEPGAISLGAESGLPSVTGLLLAGGLAVAVALLVYVLINRDIARSLRGDQPAATADPAKGDRQANYAAIGMFVALLLVGVMAWNNAVNRVTVFDVDGFKGAYPSYFSDSTSEADVLRVTDTLGSGADFVIATRPLDTGQAAKDVAAQLGGERSTDYAVYKVTDSAETAVNGRPALAQRFAYVDSGGLSGAPPELQEGLDYVILENGRAIVITLLTPSDNLADVEPLFARFVNSLSF